MRGTLIFMSLLPIRVCSIFSLCIWPWILTEGGVGGVVGWESAVIVPLINSLSEKSFWWSRSAVRWTVSPSLDKYSAGFFCSACSWSSFLIAVLMAVLLQFPSLRIERKLAQYRRLWTAVNYLYKGAIQGLKMGFTSGMNSKGEGCYNNESADSFIFT